MRNGVQNSEYHTLAKAAATVLLFAAAVFNASPTFAQTLSEIARYDGADRTERLVAGSKKEGALSFYSSSVAEDTAPVIDAFKKKYGVDVQVWRGSTETIIQRAVAETRAGRCPADAYHAGSPALEPLHREKLLLPVKSPAAAAVMPQALRPHGEYVGISVNLFAGAYNTKLVKPDEVPKSYEDLKHPRWKGRLAIEADDAPWFAALATELGEEQGLKLFKDLVQMNGMAARKGHAARQPGCGGRGAARAHRFQLQIRSAATGWCAGAHVLPAAGDCARNWRRGLALRAASTCCGAVL